MVRLIIRASQYLSKYLPIINTGQIDISFFIGKTVMAAFSEQGTSYQLKCDY